MNEQSAKQKLADTTQEVIDKWLPPEAEQDPLVQELRRRLRDYFTSRAATVRAAPGFVYQDERRKKRGKTQRSGLKRAAQDKR